MANERDAILRMKTELVGADKAADGVEQLADSFQQASAASEKVTDALEGAAEATSAVEVKQRNAAESIDDTAEAMKRESAAAEEMARDAAAAAAEATRAAVAGAAAAQLQGDAQRAAGDAARAAGDEVSAAAAEQETALQRLIRTWDEETAAATAAGKAFSPEEAIGEIRNLILQIRESGTSAEEQKVALEGLAEGLKASYAAVSEEAKASGKSSADATFFITESLGQVQTAIANVEGRFKTIAPAAEEGAGGAARQLLSIADATRLVDTAVKEAWDQYNEGGRITKATIKEIAELQATLNLRIEESKGSSTAATDAQIANAQRLEAELGNLTARANVLTNAGADNAEQLKETGTQMAGAASVAQTLISVFDANNKTTIALTGKAAQLGTTYEVVKDQIAALNLNTLDHKASLQTLGVQVALTAYVFAKSVSIGQQLAATNKENAEQWDAAVKSVKQLVDVQGPLRDRLDGVQRAWQDQVAAIAPYRASLHNLEIVTNDHTKAMEDIGHANYEAALGILEGRTAIDLYNAALRDGLPHHKAFALAVDDNSKVVQFYRDSVNGGREGIELWSRALRESQGDTGRFVEFIKEHNAQMKAAVNASTVYAASLKLEKDAAKDLRVQLDTLDRLLPNADKNTAAVVEMAGKIEEAAAKVKGLSAAERERISIIVELLRRGEDLSETDKRLAAGLLAQARAGKEASTVLNTLTSLNIQHRRASEGSTKELRDALHVLNAVAQGHQYNSAQMQEAIAAAQKELDVTADLTREQRRNYQATIDGLAAVDAARTESAQLETARTVTLRKAEEELRNRSLQTTEAIRQRLSDLEDIIPLSTEYGGVVSELSAQLQTVIDSSVTISKADRERLQVIIELASKGRDLTTSQQQLAVSLIRSANAGEQATGTLSALARTQAQLDMAAGGTTVRLTEQIGVIKSLTSEWGTNSAEIRIAVGELQQLLDTTGHLTNAQRDYIQALVDSVTKQLESAAAVKDSLGILVAAVNDSAAAYVAEKSASDDAIASAGLLKISLHGLEEAYDKSTTAVGKAIEEAKRAIESTRLLTGEERTRALAIIQIATEIDKLQIKEAAHAEQSQARIAALKKEIDALNEQIAAKQRDLGVSEQQNAININAGVSIDYLRQRQRALTEEMNAQITSWAANRDATESAVEEKAKMLTALTQEKTANELLAASTNEVKVATSELVKVIEGGRITWTNVGTAQKDAAEAGAEAGEKFRNTMSIYRDGAVVVREVGTAATDTATALSSAATVAEDAGPRVAAALREMFVAEDLLGIKAELREVNELLKDLQVTADGVEGAWGRMARRFHETSEIAATAAGNRLGAPR